MTRAEQLFDLDCAMSTFADGLAPAACSVKRRTFWLSAAGTFK